MTTPIQLARPPARLPRRRPRRRRRRRRSARAARATRRRRGGDRRPAAATPGGRRRINAEPGKTGHHRLLRARCRPRLDRRASPSNAKAQAGEVPGRRRSWSAEADQRHHPADRHGRDADQHEGRRASCCCPTTAAQLTAGRTAGHGGRHPGDQPGPRVFASPLAVPAAGSRGDNYGMGVDAPAPTSASSSSDNAPTPIIAEIAGIDILPLTQDRSQGFADALADYGLEGRQPRSGRGVHRRRAARRVAANLLQAAPQLDALWNHDDDQGIGVLAAIKQAGRDEFFMVGGAGSANAMRAIKADNTVLKATVTYPPTMAAVGDRAGPAGRPGQGHGRPGRARGPASIVPERAGRHQGERRRVPAAALRVLTPPG